MRSLRSSCCVVTVLAATAAGPWAVGRQAADATTPEPAGIPAPADAPADEMEPPRRQLVMRGPGSAAGSQAVPTPQQIAAARLELRRRFQEPLSHADSAAGARAAADVLLAAAVTESDRPLCWLMLDEARRLGEAAGQAGIVSRALRAASAAFDIDDITIELQTLRQIPLRGLDASRAAGVATAAERVAIRAAVDGRSNASADAELLASRAWQRAGDLGAARRAVERHDAARAGRHPSVEPERQ